MSSTGGKKDAWPEVVGKTIKEAKEIILKDKPDADVVVFPVGGRRPTEEFVINRVLVFADTVAQVPRVG